MMSCAKALIIFDTEIKSLEEIEETEGKLSSQNAEDKLMHSVLEGDKQTIENGKLLQEAVNRSIGSFTPNLMFANITRSYSMAKNLYGERMLSLLCGKDSGYIERNLRIPEFKKELQQAIDKSVSKLKEAGLLDSEDRPNDKALTLSALTLYTEELDRLMPKGWKGDREHKMPSAIGEHGEIRKYKKGDRWKDVSIRKSINEALKHSHASILPDDLISAPRQSKGSINIIYCLDASGSMRGDKLQTAKRAGVALAYSAIQKKDKVGLIVFGSEVRQAIEPSLNFGELLKAIARVSATKQTDFCATIEKASALFADNNATKHLVLITDALPTVGEEPGKKTLSAVSEASSQKITVSLVGIGLNEEGKKLAQEIVRIGEGRLLIPKSLDDIDRLVLEDYSMMLNG